uniref:Uncharacterized protein n=1 Tax=Salix viminalis TaxID=40686 RepID=A0A6N2NGZ9_SALVM
MTHKHQIKNQSDKRKSHQHRSVKLVKYTLTQRKQRESFVTDKLKSKGSLVRFLGNRRRFRVKEQWIK